jgi:integrase
MPALRCETPLVGASDFTPYATAWLWRTAPDFAPNTRETYRYALKNLLPLLLNEPLEVITRRVVRQILNELRNRGLSTATQRLTRTVLSLIFDAAIEDGLLAYNPVRGMRLKHRRSRDRRTLTESALTDFIAAAYRVRPRAAPALATCAFGGLRIGEALALQRRAVCFETQRLHVVRNVLQNGAVMPAPKNGRARAIVLGRRLRATLEPLTRTHELWLFPGRLGTYRYSAAERSILAVCRVLGIPPITSHALRRSYGSIQAAKGVPVDAIRRQLGHRTVKQTHEYIDDEAVPLAPDVIAQLLAF